MMTSAWYSLSGASDAEDLSNAAVGQEALAIFELGLGMAPIMSYGFRQYQVWRPCSNK